VRSKKKAAREPFFSDLPKVAVAVAGQSFRYRVIADLRDISNAQRWQSLRDPQQGLANLARKPGMLRIIERWSAANTASI
jgi:hypothetical protein